MWWVAGNVGFLSSPFIDNNLGMSKGTPKKEDKDDDSTIRLMYGYKKRCDFLGIAVSPVLKVILEQVTDHGKSQNGKL